MEKRAIGRGPTATILGFGAMRMPSSENEQGEKTLLQDEAVELIRDAIDQGITYVDTAYPYHNGASEVAVGEALKDGYRDKVVLATKCPVWLIEKPEDFTRYFEEQLERLQTTQVDMYLFHALNAERWQTVLRYDLLKEARREKQAGRIGQIGFSFHDEKAVFDEILSGFDWDFCQLMMNYVNIDFQSTLEGLKQAHAKGLGIIVMEPLLGGQLVNLPPAVQEVFGERSGLEMALNWLWDMPEVSVVLSGMNNKDQVRQNIALAEKARAYMVSEEDKKLYSLAKQKYDTMALVPCTACQYCMPCPFGLNIPGNFKAYNLSASQNKRAAKKLYDEVEKKSDQCTACLACEQVCPQHIRVSEEMKKVAQYFLE